MSTEPGRSALAMCTGIVSAHAADGPKLALSAQQTGTIVAALARATSDAAGLAALPDVGSQYIAHLTGTTGVHCLEPNPDESYYAMTVLVGEKGRRQRHKVTFTLAPRMGHEPNTLALASLLTGRTVTQYWVTPVGPGKRGGAALFAYHARHPKPFCAPAPAKPQS